MRFSIIIVTLNAGERLKETVDSTLSQKCKDYEILIKDGGSKDDSLLFLDEPGSIYEENKDKIRVVNTKDKSIYDAMNQAVKYAKGDYYIFMNTGDLFENDKVLSAVTRLILSENVDIVYGDMRRKGLNTLIPYPSRLTDFGCFRNIPCHQVCFYKHSLFEKGGYDLKYRVRADYEHFLWCIYEYKATYKHIDIPVCIYEGSGYSETDENVFESKKEHKEITKKYIGNKSGIFRLIMLLTLQPLRKRMSESKKLSGVYQKIKKLIYR